MAIALDTHTFVKQSGGTSHSQAHTITANAKVVALIMWENTGTLTSCQFGGVDMTQIGSRVTQGSVVMEAWYLDSSLSGGSHNLTFTLGTSDDPIVYIESMTGAATGAPEGSDTAATAGGAGSALALSVTSTEGAFVMSASNNGSTSPTVTVSVLTKEGDDNSAGIRGASAMAAGVSAGTTSPTWTYQNSVGDKVGFLLSIAEVAAAAAGGMQLVGGRGLVG